MNAKQLSTWKQLVQQCETQCKRQSYSSINVSSVTRSEAIVAAAELVELVTPELVNLLISLANFAGLRWQDTSTIEDVRAARTLAARIREALTAEMTNPLHQK